MTRALVLKIKMLTINAVSFISLIHIVDLHPAKVPEINQFQNKAKFSNSKITVSSIHVVSSCIDSTASP